MGIESNKEAYQMVKNTLGSIENRFREAYNKGYKDGLRDGASQVTAKLVSKILEETEADTPQKDFPTEWCVHCELWREDNCIGVAQCKQNIKALKELSDLYEADTPQTEKPKIRKRIDKPFRAVWLDDDHNEIGTPQTERSE